MNDRHLIEQTVKGNLCAFDTLVERHKPGAHRLARRFLRNDSDLEDVIQEALIEAYLRLSTLRNPDRFAQWLFSIVRNSCLDILRQKNRHITYDEAAHNRGEYFHETSYTVAPDQSLLRSETEETVQVALSRLPPRSRAAAELYYLQDKSYAETAGELQVPISTIEGRLYRARKQLKEELIKMADLDQEALEHAVGKATEDLKDDIEDLKHRLGTIQREDDIWLKASRSDASRTLTKLPTGAKSPITWGIVGGYRLNSGEDKRRIATWSMDSIDQYLDLVSDEEIANFATLFTDPVTVKLMRRLVRGKTTVAELATMCNGEANLEEVVTRLETCNLITRDGDDSVIPGKDAVTFLLTFVAMATIYMDLNRSKQLKYGDEECRLLITQVAQDLKQNKQHSPPAAFDHLARPARTITLIQAIPLSLEPESLADFKAGGRVPVQELNSAQQDYLEALLESADNRPNDFASIVVYLDPTHEKDDDHAHIVIEADVGEFGCHIDAFLESTNRPGWF